jgi:hypothetical protein
MARPGQPLLTYPSPAGGGGAAHPLTFLQNVIVYMDPATAYVNLSADKITSFINRGSLGGTCVLVTTLNSPTATNSVPASQVASDSAFNNKPVWVCDNAATPNIYRLPVTGTGVIYPALESFAIGKHATIPTPSGDLSGFDSVGTRYNGDGAVNTYLPHNSGSIFDGFNSQNYNHIFASPGAVLASPWLINRRADATQWVFRLNGTDRFSEAPNPPSVQSTWQVGGSPWGPVKYVGRFALYVLCSSIQTPAARTQMQQWAKAEFALANVP